MFHYFKWTIQSFSQKKILTNSLFWIEVMYAWSSLEGEFFLHPYIDDNQKTIKYFCFETIQQKTMFEKLVKISWIWPKTAFWIAGIDLNTLQNAIETFDTSVLEAIPGIWKKTAKKIMVELKDTLSDKDISKLSIDPTLYKNIVKTLTTMWYDKTRVESTIKTYDKEITKDSIQEVIVRIIQQIA